MTTRPEPIKHETTTGHTVTLDDPKQLVNPKGIPCIDGGLIRHNGNLVGLMVRYDDKPELAAKIEQWKAEWATYKAAKAAEFAANVPGLEELRKAQDAAYNEEHRYSAEFERMMDDEYNDGVRPPEALNESLREKAIRLAEMYPRAAMYLRAKDYTLSSNHHKYGAGERAMNLIAEGGSLEEAENILKNWLPESAKWN
jgi:hypothetical protein